MTAYKRPRSGISLVELAISMLIVMVSVAVIIRMVSGTRVFVQQDGESFASLQQYTAFKNKEFALGNSLIENLYAGNLNVIQAPDAQNSAQCSINLRNVTDQALSMSAQPCRTRPTFSRETLYYRWAVRRVRFGNDVPGNLNPVASPFNPNVFERRIQVPVGNEYFIGTLRMYSNRADADNGRNPSFTLPFSIFYNTALPTRTEAHIAASIAFDATGSMNEFDPRVGSRIFWAKAGFLDFMDRFQRDPFVSDRSVMGFGTFNGGRRDIRVFGGVPFVGATGAGGVGSFRFTNGPLARNTRRLRDPARLTVLCIDPDPSLLSPVDRCSSPVTVTGGTDTGKIDLVGDTDMGDGLILGKELFNTMSARGIAPQGFVYQPDLGYDKVLILVTDGYDNAGNSLAQIRSLANQLAGSERDAHPPFTNQFRQPRQRITVFAVGTVDPNDALLTDIASRTQHGIYFKLESIDQLLDIFIQIENQFGFFAIKRKPERYQIYI